MKLIAKQTLVDYWVDTNNAEETKVLQGSQTQGAESGCRVSNEDKSNRTEVNKGAAVIQAEWHAPDARPDRRGRMANRAQKGGGGARGRSRGLCQGLGGTDQEGSRLGRFRFLGRAEEFHRLHRLFVSRASLRGRQHHRTLGRIHHGGGRSLTPEPRNAPDETWQSEH